MIRGPVTGRRTAAVSGTPLLLIAAAVAVLLLLAAPAAEAQTPPGPPPTKQTVSSCTQLVTAVQEIVDYTRTTNLGTTGSICSLKGAAGKAYTIVLICGGSYSDCPDPVVGAAPLFLNAEVSITVAADSKCKNGAARPVLSQGGYDTSNGPVADSYLFGLGRAVISGDPNSCARLNTDTTKAILGGALKLDSIVLDGRGVTGGVIAAAAKKLELKNVDVRNMVSSVGAGLLVTDTPLTISKVAFSACAADDGAAIFYLSQNLPTPSLAANNVVFNDNTAQNECAALLIASSGAVKFSPAISAACRGCTFVGNRGNAANGGAEFGSVTEGGLICASRAGSDSTNTKQAPRSELALDLSGSNFFGNKPLIGVIFGTGFLPFRRARVVGVNSQQLAKVKLDPLPKTCNDVPTPNCSPAGSPEVDFIFFDVNAALPSSVPAAAPLAAAAGPAAPADGLHARVVARASALAAKFKSGR